MKNLPFYKLQTYEDFHIFKVKEIHSYLQQIAVMPIIVTEYFQLSGVVGTTVVSTKPPVPWTVPINNNILSKNLCRNVYMPTYI